MKEKTLSSSVVFFKIPQVLFSLPSKMAVETCACGQQKNAAACCKE